MVDPKGLLTRLGIELPIIQAPMAGSQGAELAIAVCRAGGLGSLPCAMLTVEQIKDEINLVRSATDRPFNLNFFCHQNPQYDQSDIDTWRDTLSRYYKEMKLDQPRSEVLPGRQPFNEELCEVVEKYKPAVVSFHFGLPDNALVQRIKNTGAVILSSATTVEEAIWLENRGADAVIAQGAEAGGHRAMFLGSDISSQPGMVALVPQIVDRISLPVIAAGGIADGRGIVAALTLGASCIQSGSVYLFTNEAKTAPLHLEALKTATDSNTALTNIFSGRPARGILNRVMKEIGPMNETAPPFPLAGSDLADLKAASEKSEKSDFSSLWSGQSSRLGLSYIGISAQQLTLDLINQAKQEAEKLTKNWF